MISNIIKAFYACSGQYIAIYEDDDNRMDDNRSQEQEILAMALLIITRQNRHK